MAINGENNRGKTFPPEVLTLEEVIALLDACSSTSSTGIRNRALIAVYWRAGLRCTEALKLYEKDLNLAENSMRVLKGKGKKFRTVGIDETAVKLIQIWIERRMVLKFTWRNPFFCTVKGEKGKPIDPSYVRHLMPRLAALAGISKRVHAHGLRHTMTGELVMEGSDIALIRDQLGHSNIAITDKYIRKIAPLRLVEEMRERSWREIPKGLE
ncbi:MAG: tyrosine-type recombinase/integrase [bacterium]|nr:tyrosine-type recombinase/integrase [bacterium]